MCMWIGSHTEGPSAIITFCSVMKAFQLEMVMLVWERFKDSPLNRGENFSVNQWQEILKDDNEVAFNQPRNTTAEATGVLLHLK